VKETAAGPSVCDVMCEDAREAVADVTANVGSRSRELGRGR
jgi:hypothetical protein